MSSIHMLTFAVLTTFGLAASPVLAAESRSHEAQEKPIQLSQVPQAAVDAGEKALGGKATEAKTMQEGGQQVYELERKDASGKEHSVHVSADGKVLKTEK